MGMMLSENGFDPPRGHVIVLVSPEFKKKPNRMTLLETFIKDRLYPQLVRYLNWSNYSKCTVAVYNGGETVQMTKDEATDVKLLLENKNIWAPAFSSDDPTDDDDGEKLIPIKLNVVYYY